MNVSYTNEDLDNILFSNRKLDEKCYYLIHRAYLNQRRNNLQITHSTKTRSEVKGGGKKPWKQKGLGRARAGSSRSPLWKGGGVTFGPKPRVINKKLNKKEKQLALLSLLYAKRNNIIIIDNLSNFTEKAKTQIFLNNLSKLNISNTDHIGIITKENNKNLYLATKNLKKIHILNYSSLNISDLLKVKYLVTTMENLQLIKSFYKNI